MEFTKQFLAKDKNNHSMFEKTAKRLKVKLKRIKPGTPKHNGKVESPMKPLKFMSPKQVLEQYKQKNNK